MLLDRITKPEVSVTSGYIYTITEKNRIKFSGGSLREAPFSKEVPSINY
jgi:hypothetical protein